METEITHLKNSYGVEQRQKLEAIHNMQNAIAANLVLQEEILALKKEIIELKANEQLEKNELTNTKKLLEKEIQIR